MIGRILFILVATASVLISACTKTERLIGNDDTPSASVTYQDVKPIFRENCALVGCHLGEGAPHGLQLDTYDHILRGSGHGVVVVAGNPLEGAMMYRLTGVIPPTMPLGKTLDPPLIELIRLWIIEGLKRN